jgi:hypothetical protein
MTKSFHRFQDSYYEELSNVVVVGERTRCYIKILMTYSGVVNRIYKLKQI